MFNKVLFRGSRCDLVAVSYHTRNVRTEFESDIRVDGCSVETQHCLQ